MKKIRITITMTVQQAEWLEQACFVEEEFEHSKFLNHVSNLARRARHRFQQSVQLTGGTLPDLQALSTPEVLSGLEADTTPPTRR